mgnify:FL=1
MGSHFTCLRPFAVIFRFAVVCFVVFLYVFFGVFFVILFDDLYLLLLPDFRRIGMIERPTFSERLRLCNNLSYTPEVDDEPMGIGFVILSWLVQSG